MSVKINDQLRHPHNLTRHADLLEELQPVRLLRIQMIDGENLNRVICVALINERSDMVIEIKKAMSKADLQQILASAPKRKKLNANQFSGVVKWSEDPTAYQKRLRDEW
jgi:rRNA pseudouridine-1189 N-methylase Emg1 (Nep1/Mra1 family)